MVRIYVQHGELILTEVGKLGFQQSKSGFTMFHQQQGDIVSRCFKNFKNNKCDVNVHTPKNNAKTKS